MAKTQPAEGGCSLWTGATNRKGYGQVWFRGSMRQVHRVVYEAVWGAIPEGHMVMHLCDEPGCVNPDHLRTGTARDNARDRDRKGRVQRGARHGLAKLTEAKVRELRALYNQGCTSGVLAKRFGLSVSAVGQVVRRETWRHVA